MLVVPPGHTRTDDQGYRLCSGCLEQVGVTHTIETGLQLGSAPPSVSPSPEDALEWWQLTLKKGQTCHAYHEKAWGHVWLEDIGASLHLSSLIQANAPTCAW
ncbi:hypothetical protein B0H11DRAFT_2218615 [Mycena galericulata]|nr:hypothetical protein B0H11DRAFT_2218615 [Mycena galericulata]